MRNLKSMIQMNLFTKQNQTHIGNKLMVTKGERWAAGEFGADIYTPLHCETLKNSLAFAQSHLCSCKKKSNRTRMGCDGGGGAAIQALLPQQPLQDPILSSVRGSSPDGRNGRGGGHHLRKPAPSPRRLWPHTPLLYSQPT